jgi:hypothetical protein
MHKGNDMSRKKGRFSKVAILFVLSLAVLCFSGCDKDNQTQPKKATNYQIIDTLPGDISRPLQVNYSNKIKLVGINVKKLSNNELSLQYYWQPLDDLGAFKQIFVHFTDSADKIIFQSDHPFCKDVPFTELKGKYVKETYNVRAPQSAMGIDIFLKVGVFAPDEKGWPRLKISSADGVAIDRRDTQAIIGKITF